jgi:hypothetical protein
MRRSARTYHDTHESGSKDNDADHGHNPVHHLVGSPTVDEETDGQGNSARDGEGRLDPDFGLVLDAPSLRLFDHHVGDQAEGDDANKHANTGRQEGQPHNAFAKVVLAAVDKGKGSDEQVQNAVGDGNVERSESDDGSDEEQLQGPDNGELQLLNRASCGELASQSWVSCLFSQTTDLALQYDWRKGLLESKEGNGDADATLSCQLVQT